jgi:hypothetical protein
MSDQIREGGVEIPAGMKLVPIEPTEQMYSAGYDATRLADGTPQFADAGFCLGHAGNVYRAMLAAYTPTPSPEIAEQPMGEHEAQTVERIPGAPGELYGKIGVAMFCGDAGGLRIDHKINLVGNAAYEFFAPTPKPAGSTSVAGERISEVVGRVRDAVAEFIEVARLRGDNDLPHPCDDPKLWTARMIDAWGELEAIADEDPLAALATNAPDAAKRERL